VGKVAEGAAPAAVGAAATEVLGPVVAEVAALAERAEVAERGVLRVVVEVGRAEVDESPPCCRVLDHVGHAAGRPASSRHVPDGSSHHRPSASWVTAAGAAAAASQRPRARPNRIRRLIIGQSIG
jgi:hypothetical protein